jgi:hypothetical protein
MFAVNVSGSPSRLFLHPDRMYRIETMKFNANLYGRNSKSIESEETNTKDQRLKPEHDLTPQQAR